MKKRLSISISLLFILFSFPVYAETGNSSGKNINEEDLSKLKLEELLDLKIDDIYGVSKSKEDLKKVPLSVYSVNREELLRWNVHSIPEVLQRVPGFSFYNVDYYGQYGVLTRGLYSIWRYGYSIELLKLPDSGHNTLSPRFFKNIEVARGPSGLAWGSSAQAGLINLNIRDDLDGSEMALEFGNFNRFSVDYMFGKKFNDLGDGIFTGVHYESQNAEIQANAFDSKDKSWKLNGLLPSYSLLSKIDYKPFKLITYIDHYDPISPYLWFSDKQGFQADIEKTVGALHDPLDTVLIRPEVHIPKGAVDSIKNNLGFVSNLDAFVYLDYYKKQWWTEGVATDVQRKITTGFNINSSFFDDKLDINLGGDILGQDRSTDPSFTSTWARENYGVDWFDKDLKTKTTNFSNIFAQFNYDLLDNVSLVAGTRFDYEQNSKPSEIINGASRLGLIYSPINNLTFKYIYNNTNRRPQFNELAGNPSFEKLQAHEIITVFKPIEQLRGDVTLYYQELSDAITRSNSGEGLNNFFNAGGLRSLGGEWSLKYHPLSELLFYWNGSYNNNSTKLATSVKNELSSLPSFVDGTPLFSPNLSTFVGSEVTLFNILKANLSARAYLGIPYLSVDKKESMANAVFLDASLRTMKLWDKVTFSVNATNILNSQVRLPAFGEHSSNQNGTLAPESFRIFANTTFGF
ncbi:MAG: TonB-dependent receptor [Cyanobacteriota bacterium]